MHSSIFSCILTIIVYAIIFIFGIHYVLEFIYKKNPTAFFFNRFIDDPGIFPLNASSMFHYIEFKKTSGEEIMPIDFDMVRIIGIQDITIDNYPYVNLENIPHWLYGFCNNNSDTINIGYLITSDMFSHCACIRKYYDNITKQYFDTNNNNFKWPSIENGMSSKNHSYYGIIIEKCKNDNLRIISGKDSCRDNETIDNYIFSHLITIYLIDHYSDVLNYNKPFTKYLYSISNMLFPKYFTVNNLNFNPSIIKTHKGIILDNTIDELSYFFSQNEKITMNEEITISDGQGNILYDENDNKILKSTGIVSSYYFWMQNRLQYYERNYKKLQDILSNIGGLSRVVFLTAITINKLVINYIILLDIRDLVLSFEQKEKLKSINISPTVYRKIKVIVYPPKRQYLNSNNNNTKVSSNIFHIMKEDININKNINNYYYNNKEKSENENENENENNNIREIQIKKSFKNNCKGRYKTKIKNSILSESNNDLNLFANEPKRKETIISNKTKENQNFTWFKYIKYRAFCKKNNPTISYYEEFRTKILSEENIIQNHLKLFKLSNSFDLNEKKIY